MRVEFEIPDAKFRAGQVVNIQQESRGNLYLCIYSYIAAWDLDIFNDNKYTHCVKSQYACAVQAGSTNAKGGPIRPGVSLHFNQDEFEEIATLVDWDAEVVSVDTPNNIDERWNNWGYSTNSVDPSGV